MPQAEVSQHGAEAPSVLGEVDRVDRRAEQLHPRLLEAPLVARVEVRSLRLELGGTGIHGLVRRGQAVLDALGAGDPCLLVREAELLLSLEASATARESIGHLGELPQEPGMNRGSPLELGQIDSAPQRL